MKPFKPPSLARRFEIPRTKAVDPKTVTEERPNKKRRIGQRSEDDESDAVSVANKVSTLSQARTPLETVTNLSGRPQETTDDASTTYYSVLWRKFTTKKNKTWDGDGVLCVKGTQATLQDVSGRELGRCVCRDQLQPGSELSIAGREVEVDSVISKENHVSAKVSKEQAKKAVPLPKKDGDGATKTSIKAQAKQAKIAASQKSQLTATIPSSKASRTAFKAPLLENNVQAQPKDVAVPIPRHDVNADGALIMKRPRHVPKGKQVVDVVVDPLLTRSLRQHQREGVAFLYECVMGMKGHCGEGAVLADEMGLGKTLQTIALLWTLLKQNPIYEEGPAIKKALIVCPVTLIENWRHEFRKWLGNERVGVYVVENSKQRLTDFTRGRAYSIMIIGYELLTKVKAELAKCKDIGIVVADEGHRLKTQNNKAASAIKELNTERRVILSGTPVQNDLTEFYTMVDFVNPGVLNKYSMFKKDFEVPILRSRQPGATPAEVEKGEACNQELAELTSPFILRRTAEILSKYLPTKTEFVVFCKPTGAQASIYRNIIGSPIFNAALGTASIQLELISILKKVCNSPSLLVDKDDQGRESLKTEMFPTLSIKELRSSVTSGKLRVLDALLHRLHETTEEKVVLVSNYTSTMDILARLITSLDYKYLRLDGSTPTSKRQDLVNQFNKSPRSNSFVFLLSAKAGGVGLNLIGASRLVLFDIDWNPATDLQAMARIHRDGQRRPCFIYRLLTQGTIDEKIYQRQVSKTGLADSIVDGKAAVSGFTRDDLRDLFSFDDAPECQTHRLLGCTCGGNGLPGQVPENEITTEGEVDEETMQLDIMSAKALPLNQVDRDAQEAEIQRSARECKDSGGRAKMLSLMQFTHFDTTKAGFADTLSTDDEAKDTDEIEVPTHGELKDAVLRDIIRTDSCAINYVFEKMNAACSEE